MKIPFNKPTIPLTANPYLQQCLASLALENSAFTQKATQQLLALTRSKCVLLTNSCTSALEMSALLLDLRPGDEVIMPSYTFVSTANAFVLRGAMPVFVDIRPDTLNIAENLIEPAITEKTKAIVVMHYGGIGCEMEAILKLAHQYNLAVIEDAAQSIDSFYQNRPLGSIGNMATFSFHHTKNITSGFGGALLINDEKLIDRAKIFWQKGTNREAFLNGFVDKYTWVDMGSAFLLNEINAALLCSQLEILEKITKRRLEIWNQYHHSLQNIEKDSKIYSLPTTPADCRHNGHLYYFILKTPEQRKTFIADMKKNGVETPFHYIPLHSSPAGKKYGRSGSTLTWTEHHADRLVRLPLYPDLSDAEVDYILKTAQTYLI